MVIVATERGNRAMKRYGFVLPLITVAIVVLLRAFAHGFFIWVFSIKLGTLHPFAWEALVVALAITLVSYFVKLGNQPHYAAVAAGLSVCCVLLAIADNACVTGTLWFSAIAGFMIQRALRLEGQCCRNEALKYIADLCLNTSWIILLLGTAVIIFGW